MRKWILFSVLMLGLAAYVGAGPAFAGSSGYGTMEHGKMEQGKMEHGKMEGGKNITLKLAPFGGSKTSAKGEVKFVESARGDALYYDLDVKNLKDVTMAHIHEIVNGKPGSILVWLYPYPGAKPYEWDGSFKGALAAGVITGDNLEGPAKGKTIGELYELLETGKAAVAVHTKENPDGELVGISSKTKHM